MAIAELTWAQIVKNPPSTASGWPTRLRNDEEQVLIPRTISGAGSGRAAPVGASEPTRRRRGATGRRRAERADQEQGGGASRCRAHHPRVIRTTRTPTRGPIRTIRPAASRPFIPAFVVAGPGRAHANTAYDLDAGA